MRTLRAPPGGLIADPSGGATAILLRRRQICDSRRLVARLPHERRLARLRRVPGIQGEVADRVRLLEEAAVLAGQLGTNFWLAWRTSYLAACLLALGEIQAVQRLCYEAMRMAEEVSDQYPKALAQRTLAEALFVLDPGDPQPAERAMLEAIRLQQAIGGKPELARSYLSYARMLQAQGEGEKAQAYLTQAIDMFQQMGMA